MKVYEILEATKGILVSGNKEDDICFFSQDSRQMKNGGMYIPLKGERFDGHDFIESAFQTGATAIITARYLSSFKRYGHLFKKSSPCKGCGSYRKCWKNKYT